MFERCHTKHRNISIKQHIKYFNFRSKIQFDHPVRSRCCWRCRRRCSAWRAACPRSVSCWPPGSTSSCACWLWPVTRCCQGWPGVARCDQVLIGVTRCCWVCFWHSCLMQFSLMRSNMSSLLKWSTNHYVELFHERSLSSQSQLIPVHGGNRCRVDVSFVQGV